MSKYFVILSAGKGSRFKSRKPKQYLYTYGKPVLQHSIDKALKSGLFKKIIVVINRSHSSYINSINKNNIKLVTGGNSRQESSFNALKYLKQFNPKHVFIHDAARPFFSLKLLKRISNSLKNNIAVAPGIKINSSVKIKNGRKLKNIDRNSLFITQTPQAFKFKNLFKLHKENNKIITDDISLFITKNLKCKIVNGEIKNIKITSYDDLKENKIKLFYGIGFDIHRLEPNKKLYLGGLKIKSKIGTVGHSDGDPVLHAITDAILGACKKGDIGQIFPDTNKKYKNIRSTILLKKVVEDIKLKNFFVNNIDVNIITQTPKIKKYKNEMRKTIAKICSIKIDQINIKGKTTEKLGLIGKEKAIACEVIASVNKYD